MHRRALARCGAAALALVLLAVAVPATTSTAVVAPATAIDTTHWTIATKALRTRIDAYLASRHVRGAVAVRDTTTGQTFVVHHTLTFHTASIVKVEILAMLLLKHQHAGTAMTDDERELATRMIEHSDNKAADALFARIGRANGLTVASRKFGLTSTVSDTTGGWGLTTTTAGDQATLLRAVSGSHSLLHPAARKYLLHLMSSVEADQRWGVTSAADAGTNPRVKNGWLPYSRDHGRWIINSDGILHAHGHVLCVSVLSSGSATMGDGITTVQHVAVLVRKALTASEAVPPRYLVSAHATHPTVLVGAKAVVSGKVSPNAHGHAAYLQAHGATGWHDVAAAKLTATSTYRAVVPASPTGGTRTLRVFVKADREHRSGTSPTIHLVVKALPST